MKAARSDTPDAFGLFEDLVTPAMKAIGSNKRLAVLSTWLGSCSLSVLLLKMTGAAFYSAIPQIVLMVLLTASSVLTFAAWLCVHGHSSVVKAVLLAVLALNVLFLTTLLLVVILILFMLIVLPVLLGPGLFIAAMCLAENEAFRARLTRLAGQVKEHPGPSAALLAFIGSSCSSVILIRLTGAAFYSAVPRVVLGLMLFGSFLLSVAVGVALTAKLAAEKSALREEKLVTDVHLTKQPLAVKAKKWSMPAMPKALPWQPPELSTSTHRAVRNTALGAASGAVALGTGGSVLGLTTGSVVGAACGVIPAFFTFGLSIPIGAAIGGGLGCATGAAVGGAAGAVGGGTAGLAYTRFVARGA